MFNRIIIAGNLTRDPELANLPDGAPVVKFAIASNMKRRQVDGEPKTETLFMDVQAYGAHAEPCKEYLVKGSPALIEGQLREYSWEREGVKHRRMEIVANRVVFLPSGRQGEKKEEAETSEKPDEMETVSEAS